MKNNVIYLEKRGCDFWKNDNRVAGSDVGNYRVNTIGKTINGKDGRQYFVSFGTCEKRRLRKTNKRTGKPLKHPVIEITNENGLHIDTEFEKPENGGKWFSSWRNSELESEIYKMDLSYTLEDILKAVNYFSVEQYNKVEFV